MAGLWNRIRSRYQLTHRKGSLQARLAVVTEIVAFITLLLVAGGVSIFTYRTEVAAWRGRQGEASRYAADIVAVFLQRARDNLNLIGQCDRMLLNVQPDLVKDTLEQNPALLELVRLDSNGKLIVNANRDQPLLANQFTIPQSQWFLKARRGEEYQGRLRLSSQNEPYLILALPAAQGDVVAARLRMYVLQEVVASVHFGQTGRAYLISRDGQVIAHTDPAILMSNITIEGRPEFQAIIQSSDQIWYGEYTNLEGVTVLGASTQVSGTEWIVITEVTQREAFSASRSALIILGGGILLLTIILLLLTRRMLAKNIFQPLDVLRHGTERIGQGELDYRIQLPQDNEFGKLAGAFDDMAEKLNDREHQLELRTLALVEESIERRKVAEELHRLNEELELRVQERTSELRRMLERLLLLNRVIATGTSTLEPQRILETLCRELAQAFNLPQSAFGLFDESARNFKIIAEYRRDDRPTALGMVIPLDGNRAAQQVLAQRRAVVIEQAQSDPGQSGAWDLAQRRGVVSMLLVPLIIRDQVIGTLGLDSLEPRTFSPDEITLAQNVATAAGQIFENARLYAAVQHELAERRRAEEQLIYETTHDSLTKLYNRGYFETEMARLNGSRHYPVSLIMIDVDRLKQVNDTLGHAAGDEYLQRTAVLLREAFRLEDMIARIGGDEFVVILPNTDEIAAHQAVERIRAGVADQAMIKDRPPLQLSIGEATAHPGENMVDAFKQADARMYREKQNKQRSELIL